MSSRNLPGAAIIVMIAWAVVYGELWLLTRSIWPAVLMHSVEDAFLNQRFTENHITITPGSDWLVSPVNGLISVALFMTVGVALHRHRTRSRSTPDGSGGKEVGHTQDQFKPGARRLSDGPHYRLRCPGA